MKTITHLPQPLRELAQQHFALLESQNVKKKRDTIQLNISGYADVMYLIADIVKVSMLALEGETSSSRIPEPATNISGVLGIILDLIPYEEADLLDLIREQVLKPVEEQIEQDYLVENIYLALPSQLHAVLE
ncbi:hypothetical protein [Flavobacterium terrisoli]|uniref:hypothetical protein n=1 Tax=Flavobacterium terrisoli TaxID=3242195 RepID=UPI0025435E18|nr:hypothetical protein [Flavobacterium buctense]